MAEEYKFIEAFGALPGRVDVRDYRLKKLSKATLAELPESFELNMCGVKNQWTVCSCVAHAIAEVIEYHNKTQEGVSEKVSTGFIYGNRRNSSSKSSGMYVREALQNAVDFGDVFAFDFSENVEVPTAIDVFEKRFDSLRSKAYPNRISTYFKLTSDDEIKYALMNHGPVVFAMSWYSDVRVGKDGVISTDRKGYKGGHCMVIYGWNDKGWLIQNSWGAAWGKKGCAILPFETHKTEAWGITDEVVGENGDIVKPKLGVRVLRWLAKTLNWLINLFRKRK